MPNEEYTEQLAREMVDTLNAVRKRRGTRSAPKSGKHE